MCGLCGFGLADAELMLQKGIERGDIIAPAITPADKTDELTTRATQTPSRTSINRCDARATPGAFAALWFKFFGSAHASHGL